MRFPIARRLGTRPQSITARPRERREIAAVEQPGASSDQKSHDSTSDLLSADPRPDLPHVRSSEVAKSMVDQVRHAANRDAESTLHAITHFRAQARDVLQT